MTDLPERDDRVFFHQDGSSPVCHTFARVDGIWAEDHNGHRFMDLQGNTCHNIGYRHPRLISALKDQLDELPFTPRTFTNEPAVALAERLAGLWPYGDARVLFGLSGADAIEMAMKLAYIHTGRKKTLAFEDSWHGAALGALWAGGREAERIGFPEFEGCLHAPPFWPRQPGVSIDDAARHSLAEIKSLLQDDDVACVLAEPIRSTPHMPPLWFWPEVRELCSRHGSLLIFDEIPTGLGKTGKLFSSQHFDAAPDITVLGKSLGGGALPLSAVIARSALNTAAPWAIGHYTHQKNPLLARAGLVTLDVLEDEHLVAKAAGEGAEFLNRLGALTRKSRTFKSARGIGFLTALEVTAPQTIKTLQQDLFRAGMHCGLSENTYIGLSPPLTISASEIEQILEKLASV